MITDSLLQPPKYHTIEYVHDVINTSEVLALIDGSWIEVHEITKQIVHYKKLLLPFTVFTVNKTYRYLSGDQLLTRIAKYEK